MEVTVMRAAGGWLSPSWAQSMEVLLQWPARAGSLPAAPHLPAPADVTESLSAPDLDLVHLPPCKLTTVVPRGLPQQRSVLNSLLRADDCYLPHATQSCLGFYIQLKPAVVLQYHIRQTYVRAVFLRNSNCRH